MHRDLFAYRESLPYVHLPFWDCSPHFAGTVFKIIFPSACFSIGDLEGYFPLWPIPQNRLFKKIILFLPLFLWLKKAVHKEQDFYLPLLLKRILEKKKKKSKLLAFEDWDEFFSSKSGSKDSSQLPLIDEVDVQTGIMIIWWYLPQQSFLVHFFPTLALQAL